MFYVDCANDESFDSWMNVFDKAFMELFGEGAKSFVGENYASGSFPPCNIYQTKDDSLVYELAIAGYGKDEVKVSYKDDYITVKLEVSEEKGDDKVYAQKGIKHKSVENCYYVPVSRYDVSNLKVTLKDGLLKIAIPYSEIAKPKEFGIDVE